MFVVHWCTYLY